jgi:hypothetical protein
VKVNMHSRWLSAVAAAVLAGVAALLLLAAPSSARNIGKTHTITTVKTQGSVWVAATAKGMKAGRLSPGDRLFETNDILRDGRVKGVFIGTATVVSPRTGPAGRAIGMVRGIYRFADGDLYVEGVVSFSTTAGSGAIIGGTGAYQGARGTLRSNGSKEVLQILS